MINRLLDKYKGKERVAWPFDQTKVGEALGMILLSDDAKDADVPEQAHWSFALAACIDTDRGQMCGHHLSESQFENAIAALAWIAVWFAEEETLSEKRQADMLHYSTQLRAIIGYSS